MIKLIQDYFGKVLFFVTTYCSLQLIKSKCKFFFEQPDVKKIKDYLEKVYEELKKKLKELKKKIEELYRKFTHSKFIQKIFFYYEQFELI